MRPSALGGGRRTAGPPRPATGCGAAVARYPELRVYLVRDPKWTERFQANMFDALASTEAAKATRILSRPLCSG